MKQLSDAEIEARYGPWSALTPSQIAAALAGYRGDWWVVGGWAIEAFTGVPRDHDDIDVVVLRADLASVRTRLSARFHLWSNQDGTFRFLDPDAGDEAVPDGFFQIWLRQDAFSPWVADLLVHPGEPGTWVNRRQPSMVLPLEQATWVGPDHVRYQNPEGVLLFKAKHLRPKDQADFDVCLPLLSAAQRDWLRTALTQTLPAHPWLRRLGDSG
jgi:hypothetical protein